MYKGRAEIFFSKSLFLHNWKADVQDLCHCPFASEITVNRARIFWQLIFTEKQLCVGERGEFLHEVLSYYNVLCFIVCSKVISNGQRGL